MSNSAAILRKRIATIIESIGITKRQLAIKAGINDSGFSQFMAGKTVPNIETVDKIAKALGVTTAELIAEGNIVESRLLAKAAGPIENVQRARKRLEPVFALENKCPKLYQFIADLDLENASAIADELASLNQEGGLMLKEQNLTKDESALLEAFRKEPAELKIAILLLATGDESYLDRAQEYGLGREEAQELRKRLAHRAKG